MVVARFNGGSNAGHTLKVGDFKFAFHLLPCGLLHEKKINVIGNGVVVNPIGLFKEISQLEEANIDWEGRLIVSDRAHLTLQAHIEMDRQFEEKLFLGTTLQGIGPTYGLKAFRWGIRVGELKDWSQFLKKYETLNSYVENIFNIKIDTQEELASLKKIRDKMMSLDMIQDTVSYMNTALQSQKVLTEGANALMLDLDFGTYPYVTSQNTQIGSICTGLQIPPNKIETVIGVVKAYTTRVGEGPFPSEVLGEVGDKLQTIGGEFGATTGRPRRCGWLDLSVPRYANIINGLTSINLTKLDVLDTFEEIPVVTHYEDSSGKRVDFLGSRLEDFDNLKAVTTTLKGWNTDITKCTTYEQLPTEARNYIEFIEEELNIPVSWIGVGPDRESMILNPSCE